MLYNGTFYMHKLFSHYTLLTATLLVCLHANSNLYASSISAEPEILVITNRESASSDDVYPFLNNVDNNSTLKFLHVKEIPDQGLNVLQIDSVKFFNDVVTKPNNWVLFVHGDAKTFEQAVKRGFKIQNLHNVNVIVFSWSSKDPEINGLRNLYTSQANVIESMAHFNSLICSMKQLRRDYPEFWQNHNLTLFLHSLGNYYLEKMVELNWLPARPFIIFDNIIINAAAVNQKKHKKWVEELKCAKNIYVISNRHDVNLKGARIFTPAGRQLGEDVRLPLAGNADYINFSRSVGFRFPTHDTHTYFINSIPQKSNNIRNFYTEILNGLNPDLDNLSRFVERNDGLGYDIIF